MTSLQQTSMQLPVRTDWRPQQAVYQGCRTFASLKSSQYRYRWTFSEKVLAFGGAPDNCLVLRWSDHRRKLWKCVNWNLLISRRPDTGHNTHLVENYNFACIGEPRCNVSAPNHCIIWPNGHNLDIILTSSIRPSQTNRQTIIGHCIYLLLYQRLGVSSIGFLNKRCRNRRNCHLIGGVCDYTKFR